MSQLRFLDSSVRMPLMSLPVRTVLVRLNQGIVLLSPGSRLDRGLYPPDLGITDIVAPSLFHTAGVPKAKVHYPSATVWGAPGSSRKRPDIQWEKELNEDSWPFREELPALHLAGMPKVNEFLFLHRATRSLIVTDLCFNLLETQGLGARLILGMFGTYEKLGVSRFFLSLVKDKGAFTASLGRLFSWDFDDIIVSHGQVVNGNGKAKLKAALKERGF